MVTIGGADEMSATNFNTNNDTYRKLMGNGLVYGVPRFQRDYSWGEEEWDDLWRDILGTVAEKGEPAHYMGYLVLQSNDGKRFEIIDGQQRLTTLSLIVLAGLARLKGLIREGRDVERAQQRLEGLRQTYVGYLDPVTLVSRSKLTLNRNNDDYYQTYIVPLVDQLPQRGFKASERLLRKAFEWFVSRLAGHANLESDPGLAVAQLLDRMSDRLFFTVITVNDELNAYKVFETLNSRGVRLSATDLLKNYLFSVLHRDGEGEHELRSLDDRWERIVGRLQAADFPDFLRVHWISRRGFVRQAELFKTIRGQITSRANVFRLLSEMDEDIDVYLAFTSPEASDWSPKARQSAVLLRMFSVRQPFSLLMAAKRHLQTPDFEDLLRAIVTLSFRYNVIGNLLPTEQERGYHAVAQKIFKLDSSSLRSILEGLRPLYPSDDTFRATFAEKAMNANLSRNRRVIRYILAELEMRISQVEIDPDGDSLSIEHICPTNPPDGAWSDFDDRNIEELASRLGNLTLLTKGENKDLGNREYAEKRPVYARSPFAITREVAEQNDQWTPERLTARQNAMARVATSIWRIAQLS